MPKPTLTVYSRTLYAHPWTLNIALLRSQVELARFKQAADKRRYNVLSICPVAHPFTLADFGVFDGAKIHIFPDITRKRNPRQHRPAGNIPIERWLAQKMFIMFFYVMLFMYSQVVIIFLRLFVLVVASRHQTHC